MQRQVCGELEQWREIDLTILQHKLDTFITCPCFCWPDLWPHWRKGLNLISYKTFCNIGQQLICKKKSDSPNGLEKTHENS
jgi:hypothetical protein